MQDDVRTLEHQQQLVLMGMQPLEGLVEGGEGNAPGEDGVEVRRQRGGPCWIGMPPIGLEVCTQIPDLAAHPHLILAMSLIERDQLVHQPRGVDRAKGMEQDGELPGPVADDRQLGREPLLNQVAELRPLGGDAAMALAGDPKGIEMGLPAGDFADRRLGMCL